MAVYVRIKDKFVTALHGGHHVRYSAGFGLMIAAWILALFSTVLSAFVQARLRITPAPRPKAHASTGVTQQRDEAATHDTDLDARRSGATGS